MPYIDSNEVKIKRQALKKEFPMFKLSVTREHHSGIRVSILSGPINMLTNKEGRTCESVNHFYINEHYSEHPEIKKILLRIYEIINSKNYTVVEDSDYGNVPSFYTTIEIGQWDRPYLTVGNV